MNRWPLILILILATLLTYARLIACDFVSWDDPDTIAANPRLNPPSARGISYYWQHAAGGLYIPVTYTWWAMLAWIGHTDPAGKWAVDPRVFHAANVLLHMANAVLVFVLLRRLIPSSSAAAFFGAMLFALHPVQVESVAWASGAKDLLAALFALMAMDQFLRYAEKRLVASPGSGGSTGAGNYMLALLAFALAILSKPVAVVTPLILLVLAWVRGARGRQRLLRSIAPMLLLGLACAAWSRAAQAQFPETYTPPWTRPLIAADAVAFYLWKLVWPVKLAIIYGRSPQHVVNSGVMYYTWLVPALVAALAGLLHRRCVWIGAGLFVFVIGLAPTLGLARFMFQIHSTVADHYLYLPMLGVALAAAGLVALRPGVLTMSIGGSVLAVLAVMSIVQIGHWRDSESLYARVLEVNPDSAFARAGLGRAYAEAGRIDDAIREFRLAVDRAPASRTARASLAQAYLLAGDIDAAIREATLALQLAGRGEDTSWERFILDQALAARQTPSTGPTTSTTNPTMMQP